MPSILSYQELVSYCHIHFIPQSKIENCAFQKYFLFLAFIGIDISIVFENQIPRSTFTQQHPKFINKCHMTWPVQCHSKTHCN